MQVKKQQLELDMEQQTGSKLGKEYVKAVYCHPAYLTYMQSKSCEMLGWMKHKLESRLPEEVSITSADTTFMAESEGELKSFLMKAKEESEKAGLKLNIQRTKIMASCLICVIANRWGNNENSERLFWGGSKITTDGDYSHEMKRHLLHGRKAMTNLDSILKTRDITLPTKGPSGQGYGFSSSHVWM